MKTVYNMRLEGRVLGILDNPFLLRKIEAYKIYRVKL